MSGHTYTYIRIYTHDNFVVRGLIMVHLTVSGSGGRTRPRHVRRWRPNAAAPCRAVAAERGRVMSSTVQSMPGGDNYAREPGLIISDRRCGHRCSHHGACTVDNIQLYHFTRTPTVYPITYFPRQPASVRSFIYCRQKRSSCKTFLPAAASRKWNAKQVQGMPSCIRELR